MKNPNDKRRGTASYGTRMTTIRSAISTRTECKKVQTRHFLLESFGKKGSCRPETCAGLGSEGLGEPSDAELFIRRGLLPSRDKIEIARRANKDLEKRT